MNTQTNVDLAVTALRQVDVPDGRARLTNPQLIELAHTHATLALVAELRIANEIALLAQGSSALDLDDFKRVTNEASRVRAERRNVLRQRISEGLGLT